MDTASLEYSDMPGTGFLDAGRLAPVAAAVLGQPAVELESASVSKIPFPMFNMTTCGLWRVEGSALCNAGGAGTSARFSAVVKVIQSPLLWSGIDQVPPAFRGTIEKNYPWRTEADVYASDLAQTMPAGGRLPAVYCIEELDPKRAAIWMEDVKEHPTAQWTEARFARAAAMLGRLAGSSAVRSAGPGISAARSAEKIRCYLDGVVTQVMIPSIHGEELWRIPAVAEVAARPLMAGLRRLTWRIYDLADEMAALPHFPAHGDASPQNLLVDATVGGPNGDAEFAVIDWGMYAANCAGFDLGQLLAGWVNQGAMGGERLHQLEPPCLTAYCEGLAESGADVPTTVVRRGHAISMALFAGLGAVPTQRLGEPDSEELRTLVAARAEMAGFVLDLLASTD